MYLVSCLSLCRVVRLGAGFISSRLHNFCLCLIQLELLHIWCLCSFLFVGILISFVICFKNKIRFAFTTSRFLLRDYACLCSIFLCFFKGNISKVCSGLRFHCVSKLPFNFLTVVQIQLRTIFLWNKQTPLFLLYAQNRHIQPENVNRLSTNLLQNTKYNVYTTEERRKSDQFN